jgi:ATP-dependent Lon protease
LKKLKFFRDTGTVEGGRELKRAFILTIICLLLLPAPLFAQSRQRRTTSKRSTQRSSRTADSSQRAVEERSAGAARVADQIKVLTRFLYLLGGVAKGIEAADAAARAGEATPQQVEQTQRSKASVKESMRNVREGLDNLEIDFRAKPELLRYYTKLAGVAAGAAAAEDQAAANQFDQAGRSLLSVVNRLTDVLLEMR